MAKVPDPVPKGGRKPDAAFADNVGLWTPPRLPSGRPRALRKGAGRREAERSRLPTANPRNTAQKLKPEQARSTAGLPLQTHQPEPAPEILYIPD